jgi:LysM repeat protein
MVSYRVRKGDTFLGIADRFSVESEDLLKWNRLKSKRVSRGMVLRIYTLDSTTERTAAHARVKSRKKLARPSAVAQARSASATRN